jgi:hypothetical protein
MSTANCNPGARAQVQYYPVKDLGKKKAPRSYVWIYLFFRFSDIIQKFQGNDCVKKKTDILTKNELNNPGEAISEVAPLGALFRLYGGHLPG